MKKALVFEGKVQQVVEPSEAFPVHESMAWVDAPDDVAYGYTYQDGVFTAPALFVDTRTSAEIRAQLYRELCDPLGLRYVRAKELLAQIEKPTQEQIDAVEAKRKEWLDKCDQVKTLSPDK